MFKSIQVWMIRQPVRAFFALTFFFAWALWIPLGLFAPENPYLTLPGAWAPTVSALILTGLTDGRTGVRNFLRKVLHWRVGVGWYVIVLFGVAVIAYLAIGIGILLGIPAPALTLPNGLPREALIAFLPIIFLINVFVGGPLAEDIGWRGYILPKLRGQMNALQASLIIGVVWAVWHLPYFIFPAWRGVVGGIPFVPFLLLTTSWSVLFAWVYVNTESILMPVLFHAAINTTLGTLGVLGHGTENMTPLWINILLMWLVAGVVVAGYGWELRREGRESRIVTESG